MHISDRTGGNKKACGLGNIMWFSLLKYGLYNNEDTKKIDLTLYGNDFDSSNKGLAKKEEKKRGLLFNDIQLQVNTVYHSHNNMTILQY